MAAPFSDIDLLGRLVAFDTTSRRPNLPLVDFLCGYLERPGVSVHRIPSPDGRKANLIVRAGPPADAAARAGLVLSGHTDVVPADEDGWHSDPFVLTDRGDRLAGRGSADMKGFLALAANLFREVDPGRLAAPLVLLFTYDEEVGTLGARDLVAGWPGVEAETGPLPRAAVIGEPTRLVPARFHKGHLKLRIVLTGRSAHSGYPHLGINAIEAGGRAIAALARLRRELEAERPPSAEHFPEVPFVPLNVGTVAGGSAVNVVPDRCVLEVGLRPLPGSDGEELAALVRRAVAEAVAGDGAVGRSGAAGGGGAAGGDDPAVPVACELLSESPPLATRAEAPLLRRLCALGGAGESAVPPAEGAGAGDHSVAFATDAGWLQRLGLDCVVWGPGSIEVAHRPDESIPKADLVAARGRLEELVEIFCRSPR